MAITYGAYGSQRQAKKGMMAYHNNEIETATADVQFSFGDPVFYDAGVPGTAYAPDSTDASLVFAGVAPSSEQSYRDSEGVYPADTDVNVLYQGVVWVEVPTGETATANKPAYCIHLTSDGDYKKFTTTVGTNYDTGAVFASDPIVVSEFNGASNVTIAKLKVRGLK